MLVDLHVHALPASWDAYDTIDAHAAACERLGVDALALTDHGGGCDYEQAESICATHGVLLVPGRELNTPLGHVLALTPDTEWLSSVPETCTLPPHGRLRGPLALIWAHPAGWRVAGAMIAPDLSRGAEHVHAVEALNGERLYQDGGVKTSIELAAELGAPMTGGSDAHRASSTGRCLTQVDGAHSVVEVVEGIISGLCAPVLGGAWAVQNQIVYERADLATFTQEPEPR